MRFFKVNGMYINLDNVKRFSIQCKGKFQKYEFWEIYADDILVLECNSEKVAKANLDAMMKYIKEGKDEY